MEIETVRRDGVVVKVVPIGNKDEYPRLVFLSWQDMDRIDRERQRLRRDVERNKASRRTSDP